MRFSIIVPVYNVYAYLDKCLNSIVNQNYNDFEVIVVNDGSTDNSEEIIDKYSNKYHFIKKYNKENGGLSDARNYGIEKAKGDYLIFIDGDDYVDKHLLSKLNEVILKKDYDLIKFGYDLVYEKENICVKDTINFDKEYSGESFLYNILNQKKTFEMAWIYAYKRKYWIENNFLFSKGYYHEDFGLIPKVILKSKNIYCIDFTGYHYVQMGSSITRGNDYKKTYKRVYDILYHFDSLYNFVNNEKNISNNTKQLFNSYISNATISKINMLNKSDRKIYIKELKKRCVFNLLQSKTIGQKLKKTYYKIKYRVGAVV